MDSLPCEPNQLPPVSPCMQTAQISGPSIIAPQRPLCARICLECPLTTELEDQGIDLLGLFGADQSQRIVPQSFESSKASFPATGVLELERDLQGIGESRAGRDYPTGVKVPYPQGVSNMEPSRLASLPGSVSHHSAQRIAHERQRWFRRGRRYHHGVEGRISVLKRVYGLDRCLYHGQDGFERGLEVA
jgi:hypothetical protein